MNRPEPVDYFNRLRFAEAELYLFVQPDGTVAGTLAFRIEDWYRAHEAAAPGEIERGDHQGVSWFKPGQWVQAADPFDWPGSGHGHHGECDEHAIAVMLEVLDIVRQAEERTASDIAASPAGRSLPAPGVMNFARWIEQPIPSD